MLFRDLVELCLKLEKTTSRTEKVLYIAEFLKKLDLSEVKPAVWFLTGRIFPDYEDRKLDVGWATVSRVLRNLKSTGRLVARPITILELHRALLKISSIEGEGSRRRKERLLFSILSSMTPTEIEYFLRMLFGEVRVGVADGLVLDAIGKVARVDEDTVRRTYMFIADIGELAETALTKGAEGLRSATLQLFRPVRPMLAEMAYDIRSTIRELGGIAAFEYKYDGIRLQIHRKGNKIRIYTRRLTDVTESLPDVVKIAKEIKADEYVVDCEALSFKDGKPVRFQDLVKRIRRKYDVRRMMKEIPLEIRAFDLLYLNGKVLVDIPYKERWSLLEEIIDEKYLAKRIVTGDPNEAKKFLEESEKEGHEGLMAKKLDSPYTPGIRGKYWFKIKPAQTIDCVIIAAEWGHGRRRGWLSDYHLAVLDEKTEEFVMVGKTFKGLTDDEFEEMTKRLLELKVGEKGHIVYVKPQIVVEIAFNEIQKSPKYKSGLALRFARITRIRYDKSPYDITTLSELKKLYEQQFEKKSRIEE